MYCGPSGMMMMKSRTVVNWIAASNSSSDRSLRTVSIAAAVGSAKFIVAAYHTRIRSRCEMLRYCSGFSAAGFMPALSAHP